MALYTDLKTPEIEIIDKDSINNAIKNILLTKKGTVPGKPQFGCDLEQFLFEPLDHLTVTLLKTVVAEALFDYEPRIRVNEIEVEQQTEYNRLVITIYYQYTFIKTSEVYQAKVSINF